MTLYIVLNRAIAPIRMLQHFRATCLLDFDWSNYTKWRQDIVLALGLMDLDICHAEDRPTVSSSVSKMRLEKWERLNCLSLKIIKTSII